MGQRFDTYDRFPEGFREYLSTYGWHFSKKMCEWAISRMKKENTSTGKKEDVEPYTKEKLEEMLTGANVKLKNCEGYDHVYIAAMVKADFFKSSIPDEQHLLLYLKDYFNDIDGYDGKAFTRFVADCSARGIPILWSDLM